LVHTDVTNHQPGLEAQTGLESFRTAIENVMRAVPDSKWRTRRLIAEGDFVVCHNTWSGTYDGESFRGVPTRSGGHFTVDHVHIYRVVDGRIAEHWVVRDDLGMVLQLGATAIRGAD
jgi:predicted ester cyclase